MEVVGFEEYLARLDRAEKRLNALEAVQTAKRPSRFLRTPSLGVPEAGTFARLLGLDCTCYLDWNPRCSVHGRNTR